MQLFREHEPPWKITRSVVKIRGALGQFMAACCVKCSSFIDIQNLSWNKHLLCSVLRERALAVLARSQSRWITPASPGKFSPHRQSSVQAGSGFRSDQVDQDH